MTYCFPVILRIFSSRSFLILSGLVPGENPEANTFARCGRGATASVELELDPFIVFDFALDCWCGPPRLSL